MKTVSVTFRYHPDGLPVDDLYVLGSWDDQGQFHPGWAGSGTPMKRKGDGSYHASVKLACEPDQSFWWGVKDGQERWMLFEREAIAFQPHQQRKQSFVLGNRHLLGLHPVKKDGFRAAVWAPHAQLVTLLVEAGPDLLRYPMELDGAFWRMSSESGWSRIVGHPYGYEILTSCGQTVLRADPYARVRQGPQRGVSDLFVNKDGDYAHRYNVGADGFHFLRFEAVPPRDRKLQRPPVLKLFREGRQLTEKDLRELLAEQARLPEGLHWWTHEVNRDGDIPLGKAAETEAYSVVVGPEEALRGLTYSLEDEERTYHDRWSRLLDGHHNWPRLGIVEAPRRVKKKLTQPSEDIVFYEMHVGSILGEGGNLRTSNLQEVGEKLPVLKKIGFNAVQLMPTNATEGHRDWGYLGTATLAHQEAYAAPGSDAEASLVAFVERAHKLGMRVFGDVVYNHIGGFHNDLWEFDGLENSWFERNQVVKPGEGRLHYRPYDTTLAEPRTEEPSVRSTPWGPIPAYTKEPVRQFFIDHALDQVERFGFDGLRFDFTHLIHAPGSGDAEGWAMLRALHRRLAHFYPHVITFAEEFPPHPIITQPVDDGGAGFTGMWNTEHQHRLIFSHHRPSITQCLVQDQDPPLDLFIQHLLVPEGFADPLRSATVLSNHDEVGNAKRLYQLVKDHPRGFDIARLVSWFSLLCPGYPLLFQGTEDLASNYFSWGLPHTWDVDSHLHGRKQERYRERHLAAIKEVLALRRGEPDLWCNSPILDFYRDTYHHVFGIKRGRFWIVGNFGEPQREVPEELTGGAELVLNSERPAYAFAGRATRGSRIGSFSLKVWKQVRGLTGQARG